MQFSFGVEKGGKHNIRPNATRKHDKDKIVTKLETFDVTDVMDDLHNKDNDDGVDLFVDNLIVSVCETNIKRTLDAGKCVTVPCFGIIGYNPYSIALRGQYDTIRCLKGSSDNNLLKEFMLDVRTETFDKVEKHNIKNYIIKETKRKNKRLYERIYITHGRCYANAKIFTLSLMGIVKFDEELEEHLQKLYKADD